MTENKESNGGEQNEATDNVKDITTQPQESASEGSEEKTEEAEKENSDKED